jgi:hypothetical protein
LEHHAENPHVKKQEHGFWFRLSLKPIH